MPKITIAGLLYSDKQNKVYTLHAALYALHQLPKKRFVNVASEADLNEQVYNSSTAASTTNE